MTLVAEIEARHAALQRTEEGRTSQDFLLDGREEAIETFEGVPDGFSYLSKEDRALFVKEMIEQRLEAGKQKLQLVEQQLHERKVALKRKRVENLVEGYRSLQDLGVHLDCRTLIELRDNVAVLNRQAVAANGSMAVATPLIEDSTTPTHELDAEHRGKETGIVVVSNKVGIRVPPNMSGVVGKLMKKLYIKKYDLPADFNAFVDRQTLLNGRPIRDNTYYARDR